MPPFGGPDAPKGIRAGPRNGSPPPPNKTRNTTGPAAPMLPANRERKPTRIEGTKEREGKEAERQGTRDKSEKEKEPEQAHKPTKKGTPPPHRQGAGSRSPHHKFAPKNQQKVALGRFEKIFGKIFRGNVSGVKKNPLRCLNGRGVAITNREISNLAMQITKNAQKHYLITKGKGR